MATGGKTGAGNVFDLVLKRRRRPQTVRCIAYPNRKKLRLFTPKKIGDIVCLLLKQAASGRGFKDAGRERTELRRELNRCFPCTESDSKVEEEARAQASALADALKNTGIVIAVAIAVLAALLILPRVLPFLPRVLPAIVPLIPFAARTQISRIPVVLRQLQTRQAANDQLLRRVVGF